MIGELIMRCFHVRTNAHVLHLKSTSYAQHVALNEFYDALIPLVDSLAEAYQGEYGLIKNYPGRYTFEDAPITLLKGLEEWIGANRHKCWDADDTHLENIVDEIVALIRATTCKLRFLK